MRVMSITPFTQVSKLNGVGLEDINPSYKYHTPNCQPIKYPLFKGHWPQYNKPVDVEIDSILTNPFPLTKLPTDEGDPEIETILVHLDYPA